MSDQNLLVLEVRYATILFLNERTSVEDGWHWGTDTEFVSGPFESYELAVADARRHRSQKLKLVVFNKQSIRDDVPEDPPPSGCIIVVNTGGHLWVKKTETPASDGWAYSH